MQEIVCKGKCPCSGCHPCCLEDKSPHCLNMINNEAIDCKQCLGSDFFKHNKEDKKCLLDKILMALFAGFNDNKSHQSVIYHEGYSSEPSTTHSTILTTESTTELTTTPTLTTGWFFIECDLGKFP